MRLFLDANVLFTAAHNPRGKAALVIELSRQGHWEISSSAYAMEEARRNLGRKLPEFVRNLDAFSDVLRIAPHAVGLEFPHGLATKDQPIFQAAVACRASHLLTGDLKDFGAFMNQPEKTFGIRIQTVASFLDDEMGQGAHTTRAQRAISAVGRFRSGRGDVARGHDDYLVSAYEASGKR